MNILYAANEIYTAVELQGLHWLGEKAKWLTVTVSRRSAREFDLSIEGEYDGDDMHDYGKPVAVPGKLNAFTIRRTPRSTPKVRRQKFSAWFPLACLREWWGMGLHGPAHGDWSFTRDMPEADQWGEFNRILDFARRVPQFSHKLITAVHGTWQEVYPDAGRVNNAEAIEIVLDADRIAMFGDGAAYEELEWFFDTFGYEKVSRAMARRVSLV